MGKPIFNDWRDLPAVPIADAARLLGVSRAQVYNLARAGRVRLVAPAGRTLVVTADLARMLDTSVSHTPDPNRTHAAVAGAKRARAARNARFAAPHPLT